jgi:L-asparaginase II
MKPFQAMPLVADGAAVGFGFPEEDLALCCASHHGTVEHVGRVTHMLNRLGLTAEDLSCGPHRPFDEEAALALECAARRPGRLHNNCSGKHAGMLALSLHHGWPIEGYEKYDHPVQERIRLELREWIDGDPEELAWALDGCGVPTPRLELREMARAFARLADAPHEAASTIVSAMTAHPHLISGVRAFSARLMKASEGRLLAKEGAEGVFCVAGLDAGWGAALKVGDGATRAVAPAMLAMLERLGLLLPTEIEALEDLRRPLVTNTQDDVVGHIEADVEEPSRGSSVDR